jgi:hypothetical protein
MKRFRSSIVVLFALAMLATTAAPAAANAVGVLNGIARVGKLTTPCGHDGAAIVSGAGIGLPGSPQTKNAFYSINTADPELPGTLTVIKAGKPNNGSYTGTLKACGRLGAVGKGPAALGAACGISKGYHGKGRVTYTGGGAIPNDKNGKIYSLHDITWKSSVGGTFPFYASGQDGTIIKGESGHDLVTGVIQTAPGGGTLEQGGLGCALKSAKGNAKTDGQDVGARRFGVRGTFAIVNNGWVDPQQGNTTPGICKNSALTSPCAYDSKKPQTSKS